MGSGSSTTVGDYNNRNVWLSVLDVPLDPFDGSRMRTEPLATCEREFVLNSFNEGQLRMDGRRCDEYREVKVIVGSELGSCLTTVGKTKVLAQVSCSIVEPKTSARGNMGIVEVQVDLSPMGSPAYEDGRLGTQGIELTRILEKLLRDSGVIDLEGLCLRIDKQVWQIRVDVHVLDSDGSLADCASIAALTALSHFRRPDVTILPDSIIIHSADQKMPLSLNIYHLPICVTFGITSDCKVVADPLAREEQCLKGAFVVAANRRHEICALHQTGNLVLQEEVMIKCINLAIQRVVDVSDLLSSVISDDNVKRSNRDRVPGFAGLISLDVLTSHECNPNELIAPAVSSNPVVMEVVEENVTVTEEGVVNIGKEASAWIDRGTEEDRELVEQLTEIVATHSAPPVVTVEEASKMVTDEVNDFLDGIEEDLAASIAEPLVEAVRQVVPEVTPAEDGPIQLSRALKKKR